jgi:hypothetical protein
MVKSAFPSLTGCELSFGCTAPWAILRLPEPTRQHTWPAQIVGSSAGFRETLGAHLVSDYLDSDLFVPGTVTCIDVVIPRRNSPDSPTA